MPLHSLLQPLVYFEVYGASVSGTGLLEAGERRRLLISGSQPVVILKPTTDVSFYRCHESSGELL